MSPTPRHTPRGRNEAAGRAGVGAAVVGRALVIEGGRIVLPDRILEASRIVCRDGLITAIGPRVAIPRGAIGIDARGCYVAPGFVDLHVHGGGGSDFMDGDVAAVRTVIASHARHGTTTIFPTTTTGTPAQINTMLAACRAVRDGWQPGDGARIGGVHVYGPYFATDKVGCHPRDGRRDPHPKEYAVWFADDLVRIATCAAELPGAEAFYRAAGRSKCFVTCGHSNATWAEMERAYRAGVRHVDHFWCAMSSVASLRARCGTPMQAGMEQFVLATPGMSTEVIADGAHLAPELLAFALRMLGPERLCLVTDSSRALDMPAGRYRFGPEDGGSWFDSDGTVGRAGGALASSVVGMDQMVRTMHGATRADLPTVIRLASLTPAERAGIASECGSLAVGKRADILLLSRRLAIRRVFLEGVEMTVQPGPAGSAVGGGG
jgi:N-acetylglucosamine-6-phosphate deacetylase